MSDETYPKIEEHQRVIPEDANRLSDRVEDLLARWVVHFMLDPTSAAYAEGVVLHGLNIDQAGLPASQVRVRLGAGLVRPGADADEERSDPNAGASASWRHVSLTAETVLDLDLPAPGAPRTDIIQLARTYVDEAVENRDFRDEGDEGDVIDNQPTATLRRVIGTIVQAVDLQPGSVKIAEVDLDENGVTELRDERVAAWPVDAASPVNKDLVGSFPHAYGIRAALSDLFTRVPKVIHPLGLAKTVVWEDGGPDALSGVDLLGSYIDFQTRRLYSQKTSYFSGLAVRDPNLASEFVPENHLQGYSRHGGNFARGQAVVVLEKDEQNDVNVARYNGNGIASVTRVASDAVWEVTFHEQCFSGGGYPFGDLQTGHYYVKAGPPNPRPGYDDEPESGNNAHPKLCIADVVGQKVVRIRCFAGPPVAGWHAAGFSFWVEVWGPVGADVHPNWTNIPLP